MILQTDPRLKKREYIHPMGCYFMCLCFVANKFSGTEIDINRIIFLYDSLIDAGAMDKKCYIHDPKKCLRIMGLKISKVRKELMSYVVRDKEFAIELWTLYRQETQGTWSHFVYGSYDPWGLSQSRRFGKLDSLRVLTTGDAWDI